jgi:hypothetical protein
VAAWQGGETDRDVGAAEPAERSRYGIADARAELSTGRVEVFLARVRNDLTNRAVHDYVETCTEQVLRVVRPFAPKVY